MDTAADLRRYAERYRTLAAHVLDERTRTGLLELAEKYKPIAAELQADNNPLQNPQRGSVP